MRVKYIGASQAQVNWGSCDDPRELLKIGKIYEVSGIRVHSYHTKVSLTDFDGWFPSGGFEDLDGTIAAAIDEWRRARARACMDDFCCIYNDCSVRVYSHDELFTLRRTMRIRKRSVCAVIFVRPFFRRHREVAASRPSRKVMMTRDGAIYCHSQTADRVRRAMDCKKKGNERGLLSFRWML
jgi:hypothetical protein